MSVRLRDRGFGLWLGGAAVVLSLGLTCWYVVERHGNLEFDDTYYLTRGLYHAHQVEGRSWALARLAYSLTFEQLRPPLYHGWIAASVLVLGDRHLDLLLVSAATVPLVLLVVIVVLSGCSGGPECGLASALALLAMPAIPALGSRLMVDMTLAAWVALAAYAARQRVVSRREAYSWLLGLALGLAALTKLTAAMFGLPLIAWVAFHVARRESWQRALGLLLRAGAVASLLAAPWYFPQGLASVQYARYAASFVPCADTGAMWTRPLRLIGSLLGWPLALGVAALALARWRQSGRLGGESVGWGGLAVAVAAPAAVVVLTPPVFEPRYLLPALAPLALWIGSLVADAWVESRLAKRVLLAGSLLICAALALSNLYRTPRTATPWGLSKWLEVQSASARGDLLFCNVGSSPSWNVEKVQLASELAPGRRRRSSADLVRFPGDASVTLPTCDVVFLLRHDAIPRDVSQQALNAGYQTVAALVTAAPANYGRCPPCEADIDAGDAVNVFRNVAKGVAE